MTTDLTEITPKSDAGEARKSPTPRSFFKKAPRLRPDLCKVAPVLRPDHKGKLVVVRMSNGQTRFYTSAKWAQLQGNIKGGHTTAALGIGHHFNSETAKKATAKRWRKKPVNKRIGVRLGVPANRRKREPAPTPVDVVRIVQANQRKGKKRCKILSS